MITISSGYHKLFYLLFIPLEINFFILKKLLLPFLFLCDINTKASKLSHLLATFL